HCVAPPIGEPMVASNDSLLLAPCNYELVCRRDERRRELVVCVRSKMDDPLSSFNLCLPESISLIRFSSLSRSCYRHARAPHQIKVQSKGAEQIFLEIKAALSLFHVLEVAIPERCCV